MKALSLLDEVVKNLEVHQNSIRIRKLIYAVCKNTWENDPQKLQTINFKELIQELQILNPTLDYLQNSLDKIVKTLNKPGEYSLVAKVIIEQMTQLYPDTQEATQVVAVKSNSAAATPQQNNYQPILGWDISQSNYDPFELRLELMKFTNPLRAKILAYSIVYEVFDFSSQEWLNVKTKELDDLMEKVFYKCENLRDLEYNLQTTARKLQPNDEYTQAAGAIYQAMKRYYANRPAGQYQAQELNTDFSQSSTMNKDYASFVNDDDDQDETCQIRPS